LRLAGSPARQVFIMPPLEQFLSSISEFLQDHAVKILTSAILVGVGWWLGFRRAKANWKKREFFDRVNISLNYIDDGTLIIRTLAETTCEKIFLNSAASETIQKAARKTTTADPLLPLPKDDYWYYLNAVLNELSEQFAVGALRKEQGQPVRAERYLVCLTSEAAGQIRMRKVRAMVIRKSLLLNLPTDIPTKTTLTAASVATPKFSSPNHATRWDTLRFMAAEYARSPWRFIEVDLCA
jgi:hypothetical protein